MSLITLSTTVTSEGPALELSDLYQLTIRVAGSNELNKVLTGVPTVTSDIALTMSLLLQLPLLDSLTFCSYSPILVHSSSSSAGSLP
jgi:hypothetical protein